MVKSLIQTIRNKLGKLTRSNRKTPEETLREAKADTPPPERRRDRPKPAPETPRSPVRTERTRADRRRPAGDEGREASKRPDDGFREDSEASGQPKKRRRSRRKKRKTDAPIIVPPGGELRETHENWDPSTFEVPPSEGKTRFHDLDLSGELMHAISDLGFHYCSPIQAEILPATLAGRDALGQAQTGTGKTAAFLITILNHFIRNPLPEDRPNGTPRALVLAPTRELVIQIAEEAKLLGKYAPVRVVTVFGGMDYQKQRRELADNTIDIVVATPGRLIDFSEHNDINIGRVEILVLDEADRMSDMGFMPQVRRIVRKTPHKDHRQNLFFSATLTGEVDRLSSQMTNDPVVIEIEPEQVEVSSVEQVIYLVTTEEKLALLYNIITQQDLKRVIVFCNRRDETSRLVDFFQRYGINCASISGAIPQKKRLRTLDEFKAGDIRVLVATDVAGRGIHVEGISHVINYTLPHEPENYVHRIGRTGRAGASGTSVSFACEEDSFYIPAIEEYLGHALKCSQPGEELLWLPASVNPPTKPKKKRRRPPRKSGRKAVETTGE